jgi:hypothetical protein
MANISAYLEKAMLDWVLGGATPTQPASRLAALSLGTPTSVSGSEVLPNSGYVRQSALFGAAASPAGSASNTAAMTFGPFSSSNAIQGLVIYDTSAFTAGNMLWYGTLLTARTVLPGDTLVVAAGSLLITLS